MASRWVLQTVRGIPTPTALPVAARLTPSATLTSSPSATPSPTLTPTFTATPTSTRAPVVGLMTGHVWVRQDPSADAPLLGVILERGQRVELLAIFGDWCQVLWAPETQAEVTGWVPLKWVGTTVPIPAQIVTPTIGP